MATLFSDNFNAGNQTLASYSANWSEPVANFSIISNQLAETGGNGSFKNANTTTSAHAATADVKVSVKCMLGAGFDGGPVARMTSNTDGYTMDVEQAAGTATLFRRNSSTDTSLASRSNTHSAGDKYSLEVFGSGATVTLRMYKNDVQLGADILDTSGSRITAAGRTGLFGWNASNTFDDFLVEDANTGGGGSTEATINPAKATLTLAGNAASLNAFTSVFIKEVLVNEAGSPVTNRTGISLLVWYGGSPNGSPNLSYSALTTDAAGTASWSIVAGTLVFGQAIFYVATDGGVSLSQYSCARMVPTYT